MQFKFMDHILRFTSVTVMDIPFNYPVLAHAPEFHGQPTEASDSPGNDSAVESEVPVPSTKAESIELTEVPVIESPQLAVIPVGLGESLLTMIVSVPWVLMALRKQLNS